jgi:ABC-type glycerol-3-phosphate transport system permease component
MKAKWHTSAAQYFCAIIVFLFIVFPIYWIVSSSFRTQEEFMSTNPTLWTKNWTFDNYITVFSKTGFGRYILNSFIYTMGTVVLTLIISTLAAFGLTFYRAFRIRKHATAILYFTQMLPGLAATVPLFIIHWKLGLLNTYTSLILIYSCGSGAAIAIIMLCGYYSEVPIDLFDSAYIDGANAIRVFYKILLPIMAPGLLCTAIYVFIVTWQEFATAQNLVTRNTMYNVTVGLTVFNEEHGKDWGGIFAASSLIMAPTLIMFVAIQNYFIDHLSGSIKE